MIRSAVHGGLQTSSIRTCADPRLPLQAVGDVLADELHARAGRGGERQAHLGHAVAALDAVDQPELDQADGDLGVEHLPEELERGRVRVHRSRREEQYVLC